MEEKVLRSQRLIYPYSFVILFKTVFPCKQVNNLWNIVTICHVEYTFFSFSPKLKSLSERLNFIFKFSDNNERIATPNSSNIQIYFKTFVTLMSVSNVKRKKKGIAVTPFLDRYKAYKS